MVNQESSLPFPCCASIQIDPTQFDSSKKSSYLKTLLSSNYTRHSNTNENWMTDNMLSNSTEMQHLRRNSNETTFDILSEALELANEVNGCIMSANSRGYELDTSSSVNRKTKAIRKQ